jgi:hypothetical protein
MKRWKIEVAFIGLMSTLSLVCFYAVTLYKHEYYGANSNPIFNVCFFSMLIYVMVFHRLILKYSIIGTFFISLLIFVFSSILSHFLQWYIVSELESIDNQVTPLGWQFKYRWLVLFFMSVITVAATEVVYKVKK